MENLSWFALCFAACAGTPCQKRPSQDEDASVSLSSAGASTTVGAKSVEDDAGTGLGVSVRATSGGFRLGIFLGAGRSSKSCMMHHEYSS